ncbi:hypothetical protein MLD63_04570 [Paracoccus sp. TK19116]|uniref:Uncharacterized protein n=1 Tax=Paracoccus albicereus TaxID=2922394 RepID=A0ABT1MN37_9RHOB|nr:hypothetical protein [Paracoccus albicereus]MCQ0969700.1 hypothetical protein [Paracoccus albicereus]
MTLRSGLIAPISRNTEYDLLANNAKHNTGQERTTFGQRDAIGDCASATIAGATCIAVMQLQDGWRPARFA